jgi:hypothetical protein
MKRRDQELLDRQIAVSTVTASGWLDDAHLGRCVSRRHDCGLHNLYKPAADADGFDRLVRRL